MKYLQHTIRILGVLLLAIQQIGAVRDFTVEILDANLTILDWQVTKSVYAKIYNRKVVYIDFTLNEDIAEFDLECSLDMITKNNRPITLLSMTMSGCKALEGGHRAKFLNLIYREVFRVTNLPKKCPLLKDKLYVFKNYTINDDDFPILTPAMDWQLKVKLIYKKVVRATGFVYGRVRKL